MKQLDVYTSDYFMREALRLAKRAFEEGEIPVGAVVVYENKIIARAWNQTELLKDPTAHAEMLAITTATQEIGGKYLKGCNLYVTLEPCIMCAGAIGWAQLSGLHFGASDLKKGYRLTKGQILHPKTKVEAGILDIECEEILKSFFHKLRN